MEAIWLSLFDRGEGTSCEYYSRRYSKTRRCAAGRSVTRSVDALYDLPLACGAARRPSARPPFAQLSMSGQTGGFFMEGPTDGGSSAGHICRPGITPAISARPTIMADQHASTS